MATDRKLLVSAEGKLKVSSTGQLADKTCCCGHPCCLSPGHCRMMGSQAECESAGGIWWTAFYDPTSGPPASCLQFCEDQVCCEGPVNLGTFSSISVTIEITAASIQPEGSDCVERNVSKTLNKTWTREDRDFNSPSGPDEDHFQIILQNCHEGSIISSGFGTGLGEGAAFNLNEDLTSEFCSVAPPPTKASVAATIVISLSPSTYVGGYMDFNLDCDGDCAIDLSAASLGSLPISGLFPPCEVDPDDSTHIENQNIFDPIPGTYDFTVSDSNSLASWTFHTTVVIS